MIDLIRGAEPPKLSKILRKWAKPPESPSATTTTSRPLEFPTTRLCIDIMP